MFKKSLLLMLLMTLLAPWAAKAQTTVTIGNGTVTSNTNPIGTYYNYSITEQLYTADEIGMAGTITSISFYYMGLAEKDLPITVYMKTVDDENLASGGISLADADEVFSGTLSVTTTAGWVTIDLDTPYAYDGRSNLLIGFVKDYLYYFSGQSWQGTATTSTMARYTQSDSDGPYTTSTTPGTAQANRPNIQMDIIAGGGTVCEKPATIEASNVTTNSATLTWTGGSGTYNVEYQGGSITDWTPYLTNTTATTANLTGLNPGTTYMYRVQSVCGSDVSGWKSVSFQTLFGIPLVEEFGTAIPSGWSLYSGLIDEVVAGAAFTTNSYAWSFGAGTNGVFDNHARTNIYGTNGGKWLVLPTVIMEDNVQLMFDVAYTAYSGTGAPAQNGTDDKFAVLLNDGREWSVLRQWDNAGSGWVLNDLNPTPLTVAIDLSLYAGNEVTIAFCGESTVSNADNNLHIDNVSIDYKPACAKPTALAVNYTGGLTAEVSWTSDASAWNIDVNGTVTAITENPYTLTGLALATDYDVKVQANCGGATSEWTNPVSFNTDMCMPADMCELTFVLTDSYGDGWNGAYIDVVDVATGTSLAHMSNNNIAKGEQQGPKGTKGDPKAAETETYTLAVCNGRDIQFVWSVGSYDTECSYVVTDINGEEIFSGSGAMSAPVNYTVDCTVTNCKRPTGLAVSEIGGHSVKLSWTENGEATAWVVGYSVDGVNFREENTSTNPFVLTGLEPETPYYVKVRPVCSDADNKWSDQLSFTTDVACAAPTNFALDEVTNVTATFSWASESSDFELRYAEPTTSGGTTYDFDDSDLGQWTNIDADGDGYEWVLGSACGDIYLVSGGSLAGSGHNSSADMVCSGSYSNATNLALTPDNYLVSPQITLGGSISFWACGQDASYVAEHFGVAVSTTGNTNASDFTTIAEWTMTAKGTGVKANPGTTRSGNRDQGAWYEFTVDLSAYSGQGYVAIRHFNCTDQFILNVDDITINENSIAWTTVVPNANPYTLTGLAPKSDYLAQLRANCGSGVYSAWTTMIAFTTLPNCVVPTELEVANVTAHTAELTWTPGTAADEFWQICINDDETNLIDVEGRPTYEMTGLTAETDFTVKVRTNCGADGYSEWSDAISFTTEIACPAPTDLAVSDVKATTANLSWTSSASTCDLRYAEFPVSKADGWIFYDNGTYFTSVGSSTSSTRTWGVRYPVSMLDNNTILSKISIYETSYNSEDITITILQGSETEQTVLHTEVVTPTGSGFHEITLTQPVSINPAEDLWIALTETGTYVMTACGVNDPNNDWGYGGSGWYHITLSSGNAFGWMIRAYLEQGYNPDDIRWTEVNDITANEYAMTGLDAETRYLVQVRSNCSDEGEGTSKWSSLVFTTAAFCDAPEITDITNVTPNSATVAWTGVQESFNLRYGTPNILSSENFETQTIPASWDNTSAYPWVITSADASTGLYSMMSSNQGEASSESTISMTASFASDGFIMFDAKCMGEGTSTAWDKCIFSIDGTAQFTYGALGDFWNTYYFDVAAGDHTFTWSYTKDSSVNATGDTFFVDNIMIGTNDITWTTVEGLTGSTYTINGLTPETTYFVEVQGVYASCTGGVTDWSAELGFITPENKQEVDLVAGWNFFSTYIDADPLDLINMLKTSLGDNGLTIESQWDGITEYFGSGTWFGDMDDIGFVPEQMYLIETSAACTVKLLGTPVTTDVNIDIYPGYNWIGFPSTQPMEIVDAFANFEVGDEDVIEGMDGITEYFGSDIWFGDFDTLMPGQGYLYYSSSTDVKTLTFQASKAQFNIRKFRPSMGLTNISDIDEQKK